MKEDIVAVFARAAVAGACKTRLEPALGQQGCAGFQRLLTEHTVREAAKSGAARVELWCSPDTTHPFFAELREHYGVPLYEQRGQDLGARMRHALKDGLTRARRVFLMGTDCPRQDAQQIASALAWLRLGTEVVLRPATDGGYVGIGLTGPAPMLFMNQPWGTSEVMRETRRAVRRAGLSCHELAALPDIDTPDDLASLSDTWRAEVERLREGAHTTP